MEQAPLPPVEAVVLDRLNHDGAAFEPGVVLTLDADRFDRLSRVGVVARAGAAPVPPPPPGAPAVPPAPGDLISLVKAAIGTLDPSDFDTKGLPKTAAVRAALPEVTKGITAALVAQVWADLKAAP